MAAKKQTPKAETNTEAPEPTTAERIEAAKGNPEYVDLAEQRPSDGDLCLVKVFDPSKGQKSDGPVSVWDDHRGTFFKDPQHGGGGSVVGPRRDNYKAERVRNVTDYCVVVPGHDPMPDTESIIDHRGARDLASSKPPKVTTPPASAD